MRNGAAFGSAFRSGRFARMCCKDRKDFRHYGGIFFHSVPTKRGFAGACSGSTSLQIPLFVRLAFLMMLFERIAAPQSKPHLKLGMIWCACILASRASMRCPTVYTKWLPGWQSTLGNRGEPHTARTQRVALMLECFHLVFCLIF